jgi:hypothetical protein
MRAAYWVLRRFSVDQALIGDLIEQQRAGRSAAWVWLQSIAAIVATVARDVRRQPKRAVLAVIVGLVLREAHKALWSFVWHYTNPEIARWLPVGFVPLGVALSWTDMLMAIPGWILIGWLVARFTEVTLVVVYVIVSWMLVAPDIWRQAGNAIEAARFRPYFYIATARETLFGISVLSGALWSWRRYATC